MSYWLEQTNTRNASYRSMEELRNGRSRTSRLQVHRPSAAAQRDSEDEPIAVIGLSGRYPGAPSPEAMWENLSGKVRHRWAFPVELAG